MDLYNPEKMMRYRAVAKSSAQRLDDFRIIRREVIERYAGSEHGLQYRDPARRKTILPKMLQMVSGLTYLMAANRPQVDIDTPYTPQLTPFANRFKVGINNLLEEIDAASTFRKIIMDAIFCIGIGKVCFVDGGEEQEVPNPDFPPEPSANAPLEMWQAYADAQRTMPLSINIDPGRPYFEHVSIDDFDFDMAAKSWDKVMWMEHRYRVPLEQVKNDRRFNKEAREQAFADSKWLQGPTIPAQWIQTGGAYVEDLEDMVTLADVYFPFPKNKPTWFTVLSKQPSAPPLYGGEWDGPECGPFIPLTFFDITDSVMPVSLAAALSPLHDYINQLERKATNQAINQKNILGYMGDGKDAQIVVEADDLETVRLTNPQSLQWQTTPGPSQQVVGHAMNLSNEFSKGAGNMDSRQGLGAQTGTVGQDKLIKDSTSVMDGLMRDRVYDFACKVTKSLGLMLWNDKVKTMPGFIQLPGIQRPVAAHWTPEQREGDFWEYNFRVDPYSMEWKSPGDKVQEVLQFIANIAVPAAAMMGQEGTVPNWQALIEALADKNDNPLFRTCFSFGGQPILYPGQPVGSMPGGGDSGPSRYIKQTQASPQQQQADVSNTILKSMGQPAMQQ